MNNVNEYSHVAKKPKRPHLYSAFIYQEITSTNITLKTNRNGPTYIKPYMNNVNEYIVRRKQTETVPFI